MFKRIYVEITNCCNLACSFCPGTRRPARTMTAEEFRLLARKLKPYTEYLYLHVLGEPLLHPQLGEILSVAGEMGFRVCLTTNGTLLQDRLPLLREATCLHKVSVSLHSFEGNQRTDALEGYLDPVLNSCLNLSEQGVLCALRLWNDGGAEARNGEILDYLSGRLGISVEQLPQDRRGNRTLAPRLYLERAEKFDWPDPEGAERQTQFCYGLSQQIAVLCDGTVVPCCLDGEGNIPLGNLFSQEMEEILASPRVCRMKEGFARRSPAEELCRRCGYAARFNK